MKIELPRIRPLALELHVTHRCNLFCENCVHYSNYGHKNDILLPDAIQWMKAWSKRINPFIFALLGGEPTLHPQLTQFVVEAGKIWKQSNLLLVTNGFFLHRHPNLPKALIDSNFRLDISIHDQSEEYSSKLLPIKELVTSNSWNGVNISWRESYTSWNKTYLGHNDNMQPFHDKEPRKSWQVCKSKYCTQLHDGMLWKCPNIAYLSMQVKKYNLTQWNDYLKYQPLSIDCPQIELQQFFDRQEEFICNMCPAKEELIQIKNPLRILK
jgi:organic radical activating enzyme